jgi:hypothetical protein
MEQYNQIYSLTLAQQNGHIDIATYLLSRDVPIRIFHVENPQRICQPLPK